MIMKCYVCNGVCEKDVMHGGYMYWRCGQCFTSQVIPQPTHKELQEYYDTFHLSKESGGVYDEVEDRMKADFYAKVKMVLDHANVEKPRMLDVGCGKGYFVQAALRANILAEGIDLSRSGVEYAVNTLGVKAIAGRIEDQNTIDWLGAFDVLTFWATIEHLSDPISVIQAMKRCLKPGGILLCDTGLGHVAWERFFPGHNQWYDAPQHLFVFSERGLVTLFEKCGFSIIHIDTNFDRSLIRRLVRWTRHVLVCVTSTLFATPLLGKQGVKTMRREAKWPIGRLMVVAARKM